MTHPIPGPYTLTPEILVRAYCAGIFPMSEGRHDPTIFWVDPKERGILPLDGFHVGKSLRKSVRRKPFRVTLDSDFKAVIEACAATPRGGQDTWINDRIIDAYCELHTLGLAHSIECRNADGRLVGGLYGVSLMAAFCGESMFSTETDASKVALVYLVALLRMAGFKLLDTQFVTEHLVRFGAIEIPARSYLQRLNEALQTDTQFPAGVSEEGAWGAVSALLTQSRTQTS